MLGRRRGMGMNGPLPITMTDILAYFQVLRLDDVDERLRLVRLIDRMDGEWLNQAQQRRRQHAEQQKQKTGKPAGGRPNLGAKRPH